MYCTAQTPPPPLPVLGPPPPHRPPLPPPPPTLNASNYSGLNTTFWPVCSPRYGICRFIELYRTPAPAPASSQTAAYIIVVIASTSHKDTCRVILTTVCFPPSPAHPQAMKLQKQYFTDKPSNMMPRARKTEQNPQP